MKISPLLLFAAAGLFVYAAPASAQANPSLDAVLNAYYGIKNALVADDGKLASQKAGEMTKALTAVSASNLTAPQRTAWTSYTAKIRISAQRINATTDVAQQRDQFNELSNNLFEVTRALGTNAAVVYQQYCPMKKAYWLSESAAVKNPYYGDQMLTCGKVTATLPKK